MDNDRYKILIERREEAAQALLNLLQAVSTPASSGPTTVM